MLFVSTHQWPLYPGTGRRTETGAGRRCRHHDEHPAAARHHRRRVPPGVRRAGRARVVERFAPTWLLVSAGFDAHRDDPLTELGLAAADFAALTARAMALMPAGRTVAMLEGGYDLEALAACTDAFLGVLAGERPHTADWRAWPPTAAPATRPSTPCAPSGQPLERTGLSDRASTAAGGRS